MSRLNSRRIAKNRNEMYETMFEDRGVKEIEQFATPVLSNPSQEDIDRIPTTTHVWRNGDRFWFLASKFMGDQSLWWVIAKLNNKPTETHCSEGDEIKIPTNVAVALEVLG
jgi:nucleoid-associated protein YgaU